METLRMTDYSSPDGTYNIPLIEREINNRFSFFDTFLAGDIICKKGETTIKTFYISFHDIYNIQETSIEDIFIGIYKIGTKAPIWHKYHKFSNDIDTLLIWHLSQTATSQWKNVINYIEKYLKVNNLNLIICGTEELVDKLFGKYNYISQLIPKNNRWHTEPFSQMEMVYNMINNWHCKYDAVIPNYRTYEYFYKKVFTKE